MEQNKYDYLTNEPINTVIGSGAKFHGEFELDGSLRIDGTFSGSIRSQGKVIVGTSGHVKTNINARFVIVAGQVDGNIYALDGVHLMKNAKVFGDIISGNLIVDDGVVFEGRAKINSQTSS
ncbi:MAG: polymer-forming cytoskeletal protein [Leptospiraceae bacterium]|nr:polymer-forming cytoskeletal protein [Leptospiraceae bacterium]MCB1199131.1 polymer-forming cytoskeletal protein [Leptospiraceae bacterium]